MTQRLLKKTGLILILSAFLFSSCQDDIVEIKEAPSIPDGSKNPFTLENTRKALENLQAKSGTAARISITDLVSQTHEYIKFSPTTQEELIELQNLGYDLFETPLDEDVATYEAANPTAVSSNEFGTFYTLVPVTYQLSARAASTPHQNISQIVLFDEYAGDEMDGDEIIEPKPILDPWEPKPSDGYCYDEFNAPYLCGTSIYLRKDQSSVIHELTLKLLKAGVNLKDLHNERLKVAGHEDEIETANEAGRTQGYYPAGRILVQDNSIGQNVPLKGVFVKSRRWFKVDNTLTNSTGNFSISKEYRKRAHVVVKFKNDYCKVRGISGALKVWEYAFVLEKELGLFEGAALRNVQYTFSYSSNPDTNTALKWTAANFINSLWDMRQYCATQELPNPPVNLNVWVSDRITQAASAPMLRSMANSSQLVSAVQFLFPGAASAILSVVKAYAPDITMRIQGGGTTTRNAENVSGTFFHELAHSIHYAQVGNNYWAEEIIYTVANGGYGNKTTSGSGRPAVVESWGFYVGPTFNRTKYAAFGTALGNTIMDREGRTLENQRRDDTTPYTTNGTDSRGWIPAGLLHDCTDAGEPTTTGINDLASGYTMSMLFRGYTSSATNVQTLRANILSSNSNTQATQINNLVTSYGW